MARIVSYADAEVEPMDFCISPRFSSEKALERAGMKIQNMDYFEFNEAFSLVAVAAMKSMDIDHSVMNVHGGAVAFGHPIGFLFLFF